MIVFKISYYVFLFDLIISWIWIIINYVWRILNRIHSRLLGSLDFTGRWVGGRACHLTTSIVSFKCRVRSTPTRRQRLSRRWPDLSDCVHNVIASSRTRAPVAAGSKNCFVCKTGRPADRGHIPTTGVLPVSHASLFRVVTLRVLSYKHAWYRYCDRHGSFGRNSRQLEFSIRLNVFLKFFFLKTDRKAARAVKRTHVLILKTVDDMIWLGRAVFRGCLSYLVHCDSVFTFIIVVNGFSVGN